MFLLSKRAFLHAKCKYRMPSENKTAIRADGVYDRRWGEAKKPGVSRADETYIGRCEAIVNSLAHASRGLRFVGFDSSAAIGLELSMMGFGFRQLKKLGFRACGSLLGLTDWECRTVPKRSDCRCAINGIGAMAWGRCSTQPQLMLVCSIFPILHSPCCLLSFSL